MTMKVISSPEMALQKTFPSSIVRGPRRPIEVVTGTRKEMGGKWEEMTLRIPPPPTLPSRFSAKSTENGSTSDADNSQEKSKKKTQQSRPERASLAH